MPENAFLYLVPNTENFYFHLTFHKYQNMTDNKRWTLICKTLY